MTAKLARYVHDDGAGLIQGVILEALRNYLGKDLDLRVFSGVPQGRPCSPRLFGETELWPSKPF